MGRRCFVPVPHPVGEQISVRGMVLQEQPSRESAKARPNPMATIGRAAILFCGPRQMECVDKAG